MSDIEILERYINGKDTMKESLVKAIKNLLKENKELKENECNATTCEMRNKHYIKKSLVKKEIHKLKEITEFAKTGQNVVAEAQATVLANVEKELQELLGEKAND